ncbi:MULTISPECIES: menaquinone biosynthesis protein [Paenibacillus]|uniref:Chorismate dehydratase n=1 Tax=Paenibacillus campinasensis TaxID=66347 RepID=A0A268F2V4_9BACL|nr:MULTISPECIES: menaquinone biosynthesis protein [Paenibacillus]PAD79717.1 ABC transporter substrate-binding protein [Paenibacillus campinasensis]PAK53580.1 ABC transporter substrate-binding protein [Paenibacillus sp. 7541]
MPGTNKTTVIGKISYTNAWPIFHYVNPELLATEAEMVTKVPAELNRGMSRGEIQIGALSSFAYAEAADKLLLLPDLSVSADGPVKSILLFSRQPLHELTNATIAMTNTSATSVNLLKILMALNGGSHTYMTTEPVLEDMLEVADAALLIGDNAIRASWDSKDYYVTDLGQWWKELTGCSMTFAVWAVNREAVERNAEGMAEIAAMFEDSKQRSLQDLSPIIAEAVDRIGGTAAYWSNYFTNLCYDFNARHQEGLRLYLKYAHELGLLQHEVTPELWNEKLSLRVKK